MDFDGYMIPESSYKVVQEYREFYSSKLISRAQSRSDDERCVNISRTHVKCKKKKKIKYPKAHLNFTFFFFHS